MAEAGLAYPIDHMVDIKERESKKNNLFINQIFVTCLVKQTTNSHQ